MIQPYPFLVNNSSRLKKLLVDSYMTKWIQKKDISQNGMEERKRNNSRKSKMYR
jgi:hypothetical protein